MNFGLALAALKEGSPVFREGWNGKNQAVYLASPMSSHFIHIADKDVTDTNYRKITTNKPYFILLTANEEYQPGWVPSISDLFADDWVIL